MSQIQPFYIDNFFAIETGRKLVMIGPGFSIFAICDPLDDQAGGSD